MGFKIDAACLCSPGIVRKKNEDNFFFNGQYLELNNDGLNKTIHMTAPARRGLCFAIFDGIGGEVFGEYASLSASKAVKEMSSKRLYCLLSPEQYLVKLCKQANHAVVEKQKELCTERMGSTMAALCFSRKKAFICSVGDSRIYLLHKEKLTQLTEDHVVPAFRQGKKGPLTQYLGVDPEEILIMPCFVQKELLHGDCYLICSDGLTDMLSNKEISNLLDETSTTEENVKRLMDTALATGGKDNITIIICRVV